jgi:putative transcription antitermination factor YqgF
VDEHGVERIVVGLPLTVAGEEGEQARRARAFADRLAARVSVPVALWDERLTSRQADRSGGGADRDSRAAAASAGRVAAGAPGRDQRVSERTPRSASAPGSSARRAGP